MTNPVESAAQRRQKVQDHAAGLGIDEAYISTLVDIFYTRIQADDVLGPIFADVIGEGDWAPHLLSLIHI